MEEIREIVARNLAQLREEMGFRSRRAFAKFVGVNDTSMHKIDACEQWISPEVATKIAAACGVPVSRIFGAPAGQSIETALREIASRFGYDIHPESVTAVTPPNALFVDQDSFLRSALAKDFQDNGFQTYEASSGAEALGILRSIHIDIVVCERRLDHLSGIELMRTARFMFPEMVRVIFASHIDTAFYEAAQPHMAYEKSSIITPFLDEMHKFLYEFNKKRFEEQEQKRAKKAKSAKSARTP